MDILSLDLENSLSTRRGTCLDVLRYWHQLEFFSPFDLDNAISSKGEVRDIAFHSLLTEKANTLLPWLGKEKGLFHYQLFLLPFDKKELTRLSTHFFPVEFQKQHAIELEEKLDDEGLTCFARLFVDKNGTPQWNDLSVSTLPWAMGMMQSHEFEKLSEQRFANDMDLLKSAINFIEEKMESNPLDAQGLMNLLKILAQFARFSPDYPFVIKIKFIPVKETQEVVVGIKALPSQSLSAEDLPEEDEALDEDEPLDILNSPLIRDLEKSINHLANRPHDVLEAYINGCEDKKDVLSSLNHAMVLEQLTPRKNNLGRWPTPSNHTMSLMQQLFINQCILPDAPQSIYATNGPPGTGKTTLLKDIIAENIVNRAKKLASFDSVYACFSGWKKVVVGDQETHIAILQPALTGFEMLVVSSNNAAVENITLELPLKKNLADEYKNTCHYLRPVAAKLTAKAFNQRIQPLEEAKKPWGLVSVALGNLANRRAFIERFFSSPDYNQAQAADRIRKGEYLNIWEWRDQYKGLSFQQVKENFQHALAAVEHYSEHLQSFAYLHDKVLRGECRQCLMKQEETVSLYRDALNRLHEEHTRTSAALQEIEQHQHTLYREIDQQLMFKPGIWKKLFNRREVKRFNQVIDSLQSRRLDLSQKLLAYQAQVADLSKAIDSKQDELKNAQDVLMHYAKQYQEEQEAYQRFRDDFPEVNLPGDSITALDHQLGYWQSPHYNALRSELFVQALQLHQAWLAEALQKKYFGGNLFALKALLNNKHPTASVDELSIWQSLFMVIPVVSSAFASIGRQFKKLEAQSLGWLLIDEAGQAIPQAAVGAMWRCKKAIVVGDPRQIEPIMTLPPHLIEGVAKYYFETLNPYWLPHVTSIQRLADLASPLGSVVQQSQQQEWIGLPLLVHRRCIDPMFSVANDIAYENKMINAKKPSESNTPQLPESAWFDVAGKAIDKQYVPEHGACFLRLFIWFYNHERGLPRLFVITPFKRIQKHLQDLIRTQDNWLPQIDPRLTPPTRFAVSHWLHTHIGTVHTFQGKENEKVIFVLGADKTQKGTIDWASSKPNLLNVALTRATDRIYIIGEWDIWAGRTYFSKISAVLSRIRENQCA